MEKEKQFDVTAMSVNSTEDTIRGSPSWTPQRKEILILVILMIISLMAALDATVLITILPVSGPKLSPDEVSSSF